MASKFCASCGTTLNPGARFCGGCGQPVAATTGNPPPVQYAPPPPPPPPQYSPPPPYQPPPGYPLPPYQVPPYQQPAPAYAPPPPPPPAYAPPPVYNYAPPQAMPAEAIVGILPSLSRKKGMFGAEAFNAVVTPTRIIFAVMTTDMVKQQAAKATGNFLAKMATAATAGYHVWKRYLEMTPDQALQENPQNFVLYTNQIRRVKYDGGRTLFKKGIVSVGFNVNRDDDEPAHVEFETVGDKFKFDVASSFESQVKEVLQRAGLIK